MAQEAAVPVSGVSEITLEHSDLAAAEAFYAGVLGFPVVERWADETVWVMAAGRTRIGLWRPQITWDVAEHLRELAAGESPGSR